LISKLVECMEPQLVRRIYDLAKEYCGVTDLTLGDPDIPTPECVKRAACEAIRENKTKYTANAGITELREAIIRDVEKRTGLIYGIDEVTVTAGAMGALYLTSLALFDPGDEVVILEPHWPNYSNMVRMCGAEPRFVNFFDEDAQDMLGKNIERAITKKTKAVIVNSPSNPTGTVLPFEKLCEIADIAKEHGLYVLTDEVYRTIVFDNSFRSILEIPGMKERTVLIDSFSKRFSMTGFRVGFVCAPQKIAMAVAMLQEHVNSCASMFAQYAAKTALEENEALEREICGIFHSRCNAMVEELRASGKLEVPPVSSTFYLFIGIKKTGLSSEEFAYRLLREKHIAVVPGNAFNKAGEGYIRIACTLPEERLTEAAMGIVSFVEGL